MKLKLMKISMKSFILIFSTLNVIAGFILGTIVTIVSLVSPPEQGTPDMGVWAILVFPIVNGLLGILTGVFLTGMFNLLAKLMGGLVLEFETE